jgi:hypothetical protein
MECHAFEPTCSVMDSMVRSVDMQAGIVWFVVQEKVDDDRKVG